MVSAWPMSKAKLPLPSPSGHEPCTTAARLAGIGPAVRLTAEPGRAIVAAAAVTLYSVGTIKRLPGLRCYVAVDGGMSDNPRPVLYGSGYEAFLPRAPLEARPLAARLVGKHCESGDVIVEDARLVSDLAVGDVVATPVTGAYGFSMASNYNRVLRPPVVFVSRGQGARRRPAGDDRRPARSRGLSRRSCSLFGGGRASIERDGNRRRARRPARLRQRRCRFHQAHRLTRRGDRAAHRPGAARDAHRRARPRQAKARLGPLGRGRAPLRGRHLCRERPVGRHRRRAHRGHRACSRPGARGALSRQARRHRQQGAARHTRGRAAGRGREGRRRPVLRGLRRRGDTPCEAPHRITRGRADRPGDGDRERHDELHAHLDERGGMRVRDGAR